mmetsp:Transcript_6166/g.7990  ORF Transcript_6166/g.7990 Transcript_6166/m.7990 type:complete len:438 (+) Transcript_6166:106-1419(+)
MTRFLLIVGEQSGHNSPLFRLSNLISASEEHHAILFGPNQVRDAVSNVVFQNYLPDGSPLTSMQEAALKLLDEWGFPPSVQLLGESLTHQAILFSVYLLTKTNLVDRIQSFNPDAIISDSGYLWSFLIAKILDLPFISSCSSALQTDAEREFDLREIDFVKKSITVMKDEYGIDYDAADCYRNYSDFTISWSLPELDPHQSEFPDVHYFGAAIPINDLDRPLTDDLALEIKSFKGKKIFVSMGTVVGQKKWTLSLDNFFREVFAAFGGDPDLMVVVSAGPRYDLEKLPDFIPSNFRIRQKVAQKEILRVVDVFVSHGGNNSIHEALFFATPLLVIPIFGDQHQNASVVASNSLGLQLASPFAPKPSPNLDYITKDIILANVKELFSCHDFFKKNCKFMQNKLVSRSKWVEEEGVSKIDIFTKEKKESTHWKEVLSFD